MTDPNIYLRLLFCITSFLGVILLSFAIFKIPILRYHKSITIMGLATGLMTYYLRYVDKLAMSPLFTILIFIILLMVLLKLPLFYSFIIATTGLFTASLVDTFISAISINLGMNFNPIHNTIWEFIMLNMIYNLIMFSLSFFLVRKSIGFSFISRKFNKGYLDKYNYYWAAILVIGFFVMQLNVFALIEAFYHFVALIFLFFVLLGILIYSYIQNKKHIRDRFS
ncbi:hypothetical protein [Longirhabdus pacifica]|uniref:hypothetical protein n=1 Tax=Longirhabdus pacifica TaxID=2305227 RepID=UPI001008DD85|nr:hypothetical protein [Longirhabdus pacifica]